MQTIQRSKRQSRSPRAGRVVRDEGRRRHVQPAGPAAHAALRAEERRIRVLRTPVLVCADPVPGMVVDIDVAFRERGQSKPRPCVVVDVRGDVVTVRTLSTRSHRGTRALAAIEPSEGNGLREVSWIEPKPLEVRVFEIMIVRGRVTVADLARISE